MEQQAGRLFVRTPRAPSESPTFEMSSFGAGGHFSRHNIDKASALIEADDIERVGTGKR